ncbi:hypothetical protein SP15_273 [Bacillus phage SP-15]|uniref:DUF2786 domain-containing protein n=1 Tax=Bacillus phage SP-15 TaxID=1792032 RepID=A0A127AZ63_9CAUD|nr:hypothetical protein SP15_273 [Bacillus phage SP-15]AMM45081.1 hypothetical protein SP15_273 [Bacillus phage SP-15]
MREKIIQRLKNLQAVVNDSGATEAEKATARQFIDHLTAKYDIDIDFNVEEEEKEFKKVCKDQYHTDLLISILGSYDIRAYEYRGRGRRDNKVYFKTTPTMKELVMYELKFHYRNLSETFRGIMAVYEHKFIHKPKPKMCDNCSYLLTTGECANSLSGRHLEDVRGQVACQMYKSSKPEDNNESSVSDTLRDGIRAGWILFGDADYHVRKGIE